MITILLLLSQIQMEILCWGKSAGDSIGGISENEGSRLCIDKENNIIVSGKFWAKEITFGSNTFQNTN